MNKQLGMLLIFVSVTLFSCFDTHKDRPKDISVFEKEMGNRLITPPPRKPVYYVSGMYVLIDQNIFCTTWDTVWVSKRRKEVNSYTIRRKTVFQRSVGEQVFPEESYQESWTGSYNAAGEKMEALTEAQALQVHGARNGLELDGNFYKKIE